MVLALNYGGRDEICRAFHKILDDSVNGKLEKEKITEALISSYLDTGRPDTDLLIRTSGEKRISNFLIWQLSYAEIHFIDILWPDFTPSDLLAAVEDFQRRER